MIQKNANKTKGVFNFESVSTYQHFEVKETTKAYMRKTSWT